MLAAVEILTDDRAFAQVRAQVGDGADIDGLLFDTRLRIADDLRVTALDLSLAVATDLLVRAEVAVGDDELNRTEGILADLAPLVDAEAEPHRYVELQSNLAELRHLQSDRSGDIGLLRQSADAAQSALDIAEELGEPETIGMLTTWGRIQLDIARRTGDTLHFDRAEQAFERVADAYGPDGDALNWAMAQNNVAVVRSDRAKLEDDSTLLADAAETYRRIRQRLDPDRYPEKRALYSRNLANSLTTLGAWERSSAPVREAIAILEELRSALDGQETSLTAADTIEALAHAWWQLGAQERNMEAFENASVLMARAVEIYDPDTASRHRTRALQWQADIESDKAELASNPEMLLDAANLYGDARWLAARTGQVQAYVEASLRRAKALRRAKELGGFLDRTEEPSELAQAAAQILKGVPDAQFTPELERLEDEIGQFLNEIGEKP